MLTIYELLDIVCNMKYEHIANDPDFIDFCNRRKHKTNTTHQYLHALGMYTDLIGKSLPELIKEAEDEEDEGIRLRKRTIRKHLSKFQQHIESLGYSESSKKVFTTCVRAYYNEYEIQLPKRFKNNARSDRKEKLYNDLPTLEDIRHLLKYANLTFTAIILLGLSSGMSRAEICSLKFKDFYNAIDLKPFPKNLDEFLERVNDQTDIIPFWQITRIKTENSFFTFSTPESTEAIINYIADLNRRNKKHIAQNRTTQIVITPETSLFLSSYMNRMSETVVSIAYKRMNENAGFEKKDNKSFIRPHILREVFASTLEKNKMTHLMTRWIMGHKLDSTTSAYFKADPEAVKEEYIQFLSHLTINQNIEVKTVTTEGYDQLLKDSKEKKEKIKFMEQEIQKMKKHNEERDKILDKIIHEKEIMENIIK
jgi:integrase